LTTYEYKHNEPPLKIEAPQLNYTFDEDEEEGEQQQGEGADGGIDFGDLEATGDEIVLETGKRFK